MFLEDLKCCGNCANYLDGECEKIKVDEYENVFKSYSWEFCPKWKFDSLSISKRIIKNIQNNKKEV